MLFFIIIFLSSSVYLEVRASISYHRINSFERRMNHRINFNIVIYLLLRLVYCQFSRIILRYNIMCKIHEDISYDSRLVYLINTELYFLIPMSSSMRSLSPL